MAKKTAHYQAMQDISWQFCPQNGGWFAGLHLSFVWKIHGSEPAFSFGVFCLTKKADSTLLLRTGTRTISRRFWFSNDLYDVKALELSVASYKREPLSAF